MCSALVLAYGLKNEVYSCAGRLFCLAHRLKNEESSCVARLFWLIVH